MWHMLPLAESFDVSRIKEIQSAMEGECEHCGSVLRGRDHALPCAANISSASVEAGQIIYNQFLQGINPFGKGM